MARRLLDAEHMLLLAKRQGSHPALVFLDINRFKEINDRHGHRVGDLVLERVGVRLRRRTRESDLVAGFGVAHHPVDGATIDALLAMADKAMYAAKASNVRRRRRSGLGAVDALAENRASQ